MMKRRILPVIMAIAMMISCIVPVFGSSATVYDIELDYVSTHGTFTLSDDTAAKGETVYITADPDTGYEVGSVIVRNKTTGAYTEARSNINGIDFYFVMPDSDVVVEATFVRDRDGSSTRYYVDLDYNEARGTADVSAVRATQGTIVYITADPNSGYSVDDVIVTEEGDGSDVIVYTSSNANGDYYFRMPADDVYVEIIFARGGSGSSSGSSTGYYDIDTVYDEDCGYVDLSEDSAREGTKVYVYPEADRGFEL